MTDIRQHGSGNIGATNVQRVLGWKAAVWVYLLDIAKGVLVVLVANYLLADTPPVGLWPIVAAVVVILGHIFSPWLRGRGGKGVSTAVGAMLGIAPLPVVGSLVMFGIVVAVSRFVSLGSIVGALCFPLLVVFTVAGGWQHSSVYLTVISFVLPALIIYTHRSNIRRLLAGTENRVGRAAGGQGG